MSMILAIETATQVCSVALGNSKGILSERNINGKGVHSDHTFLFARELLEQHSTGISDLEAVLFSHGPGSYTGLRIGASAIKGMLYRQDVPLYSLSSLTSYALPFVTNTNQTIHSVIDARREHLYYQKIVNEGGQQLQIQDEIIIRIDELVRDLQAGDIVTGTGLDRIHYPRRDELHWYSEEFISAKNLILAWNNQVFSQLFQKRDVKLFEPAYLTMSQLNNSEM